MLYYEEFLIERLGYNDSVRKSVNQIVIYLEENLDKLIKNNELLLEKNIDEEDLVFELKIQINLVEKINRNSFFRYKDVVFDNNILKNCFININIFLDEEEKLNFYIKKDNSFREILSHEIQHIFERYNQLKKNKSSLSWEYLDNYNVHKHYMKNKINKKWDIFLHYFYFCLDHEINSRISQIAEIYRNGKVKDIKNTIMFKTYDKISKLDVLSFIEELENENNYLELINDFCKRFGIKEKDFEKIIELLKEKSKNVLKRIYKTISLEEEFKYGNVETHQD